MVGSSSEQPTAASTTAKAPTAGRSTSENDRSLYAHHSPMRLRSGAWPRHVRVEITRINNRLNVALVDDSGPRRQAVADAIRAHLSEPPRVRWRLVG